MKNIFLKFNSVNKVYAELQNETRDFRAIAYRFTLQFLSVKITHVPSGATRIAPLFF